MAPALRWNFGWLESGGAMPLAEVGAAGGVGDPQPVLAVREIDPGLPDRNVKPVLFQRPQERHLDVEIVLVEGLVDQVLRERRHLLGRHDGLELALGRRAPRDTDDLADPAGFHFVQVLLRRQTPELVRGLAGRDSVSEQYCH